MSQQVDMKSLMKGIGKKVGDLEREPAPQVAAPQAPKPTPQLQTPTAPIGKHKTKRRVVTKRQLRDKYMKVHVTEKELKVVRKGASLTNAQGLSDFVRRTVLHKVKQLLEEEASRKNG